MGDAANQVIAGVREGDVLAGKYRIERILGTGGMGVVVAAQHLQLEERVAIKFLLPDAVRSPEAVKRFAREAKAAVKIKSEHVARVIDVGTLETGAPYMVMEFLEGIDLAAWVQQRGALDLEPAVDFVVQACDAIADAHSLGIIHRDLKPSNLFCIRRNDGQFSVKVLDFGISKLTGFAASGPEYGMTRTAEVMGSPYYMSPEQVQSSREVDARSDVWAMGVILYELLAGQVPFGGDNLATVVLRIMSAPPPSLRGLRPEVPEGLEAVIFRCLEKARADRYQNIAELAVALVEFAPKRARVTVERISRVIQGAGLSASAVALPPSSVSGSEGVAAGTQAAWGQTERKSRARRPWLFGALASAVAIGAVALVLGGHAWRASKAAGAPAGASIAVTLPESAPSPPPPAEPPPPAVSTVATTESVVAPVEAAVGGSRARPPPPPPSAAPKKNCSPNYILDHEGQKHFKPECFR